MSASLTLFCDEAGHTGIDLCGLDQPFFVAAGYLVAGELLDACRGILVRHLAELNHERKSHASELKSSSLLGSVRGRRRLAAILREVEATGAVPLVIAIEKRFSLGGRFVDDYLDLGDNPRAGPQFCLDRDVKRAAATIIGESSDETLLAIERALREPSRENRQRAVEAVVADLRRRGEPELAFVTEGILINPRGLEPQRDFDLSFPDFAASNTPNPTSLNSLIVAADEYAASVSVDRVRLVHDNTEHMEAVLRHVYWIASDPEVHARLSQTPFLELPPRVERVAEPEFVSSETEPLVQAADLLAGGIAYWLKKAYRREVLDASAREIAEATLTVFLDRRVAGAGAVLSDSLDWLSALSKQLDHSLLRKAAAGPIND